MKSKKHLIISAIVHVIVIVLLAVWTFDDQIKAATQMLVASAPREEIEDPPVEIELQEEIETVTEETVSVFSAAPAVGIAGMSEPAPPTAVSEKPPSMKEY